MENLIHRRSSDWRPVEWSGRGMLHAWDKVLPYRPRVHRRAAYRSKPPIQKVFDLGESLDAIFERMTDFDVLAFRDRRWLRGIRGQAGRSSANPMGTVHGGSAMTLIDSATGCAGYSLVSAGAGFGTIETKVNLSRPIASDTGRVRAEARWYRRPAR